MSYQQSKKSRPQSGRKASARVNREIKRDVYPVQESKWYEDYLDLPKYSHVSMAVIHPSPVRKSRPNADLSPEMQPEAFRHRLCVDEDRPKPRTEGLPDELVRPPKDFAAIQAAEAFYRKK